MTTIPKTGYAAQPWEQVTSSEFWSRTGGDTDTDIPPGYCLIVRRATQSDGYLSIDVVAPDLHRVREQAMTIEDAQQRAEALARIDYCDRYSILN